jgi:hypothetical protein
MIQHAFAGTRFQIRLFVRLKLSNGAWLIGDQSDVESLDWRVSKFNIQDIRWRVLKTKDIVEGARIDRPDLSRRGDPAAPSRRILAQAALELCRQSGHIGLSSFVGVVLDR